MTEWKKKIALFLSSQSLSLLGSSIVQYAIMWHITLTTESGLMMTLYIIVGFVPTFFLSPFAGVWADRYNRKKLIMLADGGIAAATLVLAVLYLAGYQYIWLLFIISAIRALGGAVQGPAVGAMLPQIVPEEKLLNINGLNGAVQSAIMFISPLISAGLLSIYSLEQILFVDILTATLAIVILAFLKVNKQQTSDAKVVYLDDLKAGIRYIKSHSFLKPLFLFFAVLFILMAPVSFLTPLQVTRTFGGDEWRLMTIEMGFTIGMMIGGGLLASLGGMKNHIHTMAISGVIFSLCTIGFGISPNFWLYTAVMLLCGLAMPFFNSPVMTMLQEKVDPAYLGRTFSIFNMITTSMMPLGMLIFGPLSDQFPIEAIMVGTGILMLLLITLMAKNKALLEAGQQKKAAEEAVEVQ